MRSSIILSATLAAMAATVAFADGATNAPADQDSVDLTASQLNAIKIEAIGTHSFSVQKEAVGSIDFDEDLSVPVFPPYQGKLLKTFASLGDKVETGQPLYTVDSPDLIQAESNLIGAAATLDLTTKELARVKDLSATNGISQREFEQVTSDHQTAQGAFNAARDTLHLFGKTAAEIDEIVAKRHIDPALVVRSPLAGQVTYMSAPAGLTVQPGTLPAPYSVADISTKWMLAQVTENDCPLFHEGQPLEARVLAYPGHVFDGKISKIYATVDPSTHRMTLRSEVKDPRHELKPGMFVSFVIQVSEPVQSTSIPVNGVVRNGDGTMAAWITTDRRHFVQRIVKIGLESDGQYQVLEGLRPGELAVTDGAVFVSNILYAPPSD
jgi:cobalt-zinc-cadmium efflux system membrane fusion protein